MDRRQEDAMALASGDNGRYHRGDRFCRFAVTWPGVAEDFDQTMITDQINETSCRILWVRTRFGATTSPGMSHRI